MKEKEALEASLTTLTTRTTDQNASNAEISNTSSDILANDTNEGNNMDQLQLQISTLMNSLATLSAEKSKMEASFQADKRALRSELKAKDKCIIEMQEKLNNAAAQTKLEVEKVKSKLIIERHDWEKESGNQLAMVKELQKLLADERQIKDNLQMQLNDLKVHMLKSGNESNQMSELTTELEQLKRKLKENERELMKSGARVELPSADVLKRLQSEMMHLTRQHTAAIQSEQNRAYLAEERNKALAARHEERVSSLESRLAELSDSIGLYDRLRQTDQEIIAKLKEKVAQLSNSSIDDLMTNDKKKSIAIDNQSNYNGWNVNELINEIILLHNVLLLENSKLDEPLDTSRLYNAFNSAAGLTIDSSCNCAEKCATLLKENAQIRTEFEQSKEQIEIHKTHIKTLQSKVEVLNRNIDELEMELRNKAQEHNSELRAERNRWKEIVSITEIEFRTKQSELEIQLQKQRERSLALLEEKENEIGSLKASFDIFMMPKLTRKRSEASSNGDNNNHLSGNELKDSLTNIKNVFHGSSDDVNQTSLTLSNKVTNASTKEPMHMLHYVHELSRKEVEIAALRKGKHMAEQTLRQALQDKAATQQSLYDKIATLEEQVDRLERCKTREGANLEYLKNVFLSFLLSNDMEGRRHKVNAIGAVLQFNPSETATVNKYFHIKDTKK